MKAIQVTARAAIHEGKLEEFKVLAAQCMRTVRERDSGTLQYDWFFNQALS
jgi:quinol monooxygenase YgiN